MYYNLWHVERTFRISKSKIEITRDVPLHPTAPRDTCLHLLCSTEGLQGTGKAAETILSKYEC